MKISLEIELLTIFRSNLEINFQPSYIISLVLSFNNSKLVKYLFTSKTKTHAYTYMDGDILTLLFIFDII